MMITSHPEFSDFASYSTQGIIIARWQQLNKLDLIFCPNLFCIFNLDFLQLLYNQGIFLVGLQL